MGLIMLAHRAKFTLAKAHSTCYTCVKEKFFYKNIIDILTTPCHQDS